MFAVPVLGATLLVGQQQPPASSTDNTTGERTEATVPRQAEDRDYGWIGLLGLLGLLGLRRRRPAEVVRVDERTRGYDEGQRAA